MARPHLAGLLLALAANAGCSGTSTVDTEVLVPGDAGEVDGGGDAGPGSDGGPLDAGLVDGGRTDAGTPDSGIRDGGAPDAGPVDGGGRDGGPLDAGPRDAGPALFTAARSGSFARANCGAGCTGSSVPFSLTVTSNQSQAVADAELDARYAIEGQAQANATGTCSCPNVFTATRQGSFNRSNCGAGCTGSAVSFSVTATSTVSQAAADAEADARLPAEGQAHADATGSCSCPTVFTATRQGSFNRSNCGANCSGSAEGFSLTVTSTVSQAAADAEADSRFPAEGQAHADAAGSCSCTAVCTACEDYANHSVNNPHLYATSTGTPSYAGNALGRCPPQYRVDGLTGWKPMTYVGDVPGTDVRAWHYVEPTDGVARNTHLQSTLASCSDQADVREQQPYSDRQLDWIGLPGLAPLANPSTEELPLFISAECIDEQQGRPYPTDFQPVYGVYTANGEQPGLQYRVNGGDWNGFGEGGEWGYFFHRPRFRFSGTGFFATQKDFILDITRDQQNVERFTVHRHHQGGHYSTVATFTRQDGRTFVTAQLLNAEASQLLRNRNTGATYPSHSTYGMLFDLGVQPDGDLSMELLGSAGVVVDGDVLVRVKRTP